jgi:hypothetical protein
VTFVVNGLARVLIWRMAGGHTSEHA